MKHSALILSVGLLALTLSTPVWAQSAIDVSAAYSPNLVSNCPHIVGGEPCTLFNGGTIAVTFYTTPRSGIVVNDSGERGNLSGPIANSTKREAVRLATAAGEGRGGHVVRTARAHRNGAGDHPVRTCALIGAAVGLVAGIQLSRGECMSSSCSAQALLGLPLYGAAIGATAGLIAKLSR